MATKPAAVPIQMAGLIFPLRVAQMKEDDAAGCDHRQIVRRKADVGPVAGQVVAGLLSGRQRGGHDGAQDRASSSDLRPVAAPG